MNVLVIDVGGSHVKLTVSGIKTPQTFDSSPDLTPGQLVERVKQITQDWEYDAVALGLPAVVGPRGLMNEPGNLGKGWVDFDFEHAFERPVRLVNDAAMQALGAYEGGRMLFLGLGTGVGSALVTSRILIPLELGNLPWNGKTLADHLGKEGFERIGRAAWREATIDAALKLKPAFAVDYVMLGGGKAGEGMLNPLPHGLRQGSNEDAFTGGFRLWEEDVEPHNQTKRLTWLLVT